MPAGEFVSPIPPPPDSAEEESWLWTRIKDEARRDAESEPALASYLYSTILSHSSLERSLSFHLGNKLCSSTLLSTLLYDLFLDTFSNDDALRSATVADLRAARFRDPACVLSLTACLITKGFWLVSTNNIIFVGVYGPFFQTTSTLGVELIKVWYSSLAERASGSPINPHDVVKGGY
ncbi:unnamed protein product [Ilex paraguariensis]|uniref:Serine acetyltransferase N-terminal domain-containing protein n=1 Tax=Ilex paraguariensis TaxID=185542 RepID=A0ABC8V041_9AQUA